MTTEVIFLGNKYFKFENIYSQINDHTRQSVKIRDNVHNDKMINDNCKSLIKQFMVRIRHLIQ